MIKVKTLDHFFKLSQNHPNPFSVRSPSGNPTTKISYTAPLPSNVELKVFDAFSREIKTVVNEMKDAGAYETTFDGSSLSSGVYFLRLKTGSFTEVKKMVLVR